jgi:hypothetical protein
MKIFALVCVRNESETIRVFAHETLRFVDGILFLDDCSSDATVEVINEVKRSSQKCVEVLTKPSWYRDEPGDRNSLLDLGRSMGGTHFLVLDADELLTSNFHKAGGIRQICEAMAPGDSIEFQWIQLWRSTSYFRVDGGKWGENYKPFLFCDNGYSRYVSEFIHTGRVPQGLNGRSFRITGPDAGVLHFQFSNWRSVLLKHFWYRALEYLRFPEKRTAAINARYDSSLDEAGLKVKVSLEDWFYWFEMDVRESMIPRSYWRAGELLSWCEMNPKLVNSGLSIDWELISKMADVEMSRLVAKKESLI